MPEHPRIGIAYHAGTLDTLSHKRGFNLFIGCLQLKEDWAQTVIATSNRNSRLAYPVIEIEMLCAIGKGKHVWMNGSPCAIAEAFWLAQFGIEDLSLLH